MKKNYFSTLFAALMLFVAMPAKAQMSSVADFFGKYTFTANVEMTDAGKALGITFPNECEVVIAKCSDNIYDGQLQGLPGATGVQKINGIDTEKNVLKITNPNQGYPWGNLYMSDGNGMNPYGRDSMYNDVEYAYDPDTKTIAMPDFTVVSMNSDFSVATVIVKFTGAKLTLVEAETIEVADLSGEWHYTAGKGTYDTMEGSTLPLEWDMTLTATDDSYQKYNVSLALGDFDPMELEANFNGVSLIIPFDSIFFDAESRISLWDPYGGRYKGDVEFNMINENTLSLSMMYIRQDSISPEIKGGALQYYMNGLAKREGAEDTEFTWDGTYKVGGTLSYSAEGYDFPVEFDIVVEYNEDWGIYLVTEFLGYDVVALNYGGLDFTPSTDDPNKAEIKPGYLKTVVAGESYLHLKDMNLGNESIVLTRNEDGTITLDDFCVSENENLVAFYQDVTAEKEVEEPFSWIGTFAVKANDVQIYNQDFNHLPAEFEVEVEYNKDWSIYLVTKIFGMDVAALNYGGIDFNISTEDPNKAEIKTGALVQSIIPGEAYLCLMDQNASDASNIQLTYNGDGTITVDNFCIAYMTYNADWSKKYTAVALYSNVTAEKKEIADGIESITIENKVVEGIFDIFGRRLDAITTPGLYIVNGNKVLVK